jgi:hypothetical protein
MAADLKGHAVGVLGPAQDLNRPVGRVHSAQHEHGARMVTMRRVPAVARLLAAPQHPTFDVVFTNRINVEL